MAEEQFSDEGKGGGSDDKQPKPAPTPACVVFVRGRCDGVTCNCPASGGVR